MRSLIGTAALFPLTLLGFVETGSADTLKIVVQDHTNSGVPSNIYVYQATTSDEKNRLVIGETNAQGVFELTHKCEASQIIKASPKSRGEYFDSTRPCRQEIAITVIRRSTPMGMAFNGIVTDVTLPDGSAGLIATWAFLDTNKTENKLPTNAGITCDVSVRPRLNHEVYRVTDGMLAPVANANTASAYVLSHFNATGQVSAVFPTSCDEAKSKIMTLEERSAAKIDNEVSSKGLIGKILNFQGIKF